MSQDIDIMQKLNDVDLSTVETSFPLLKTGIVQATITECGPQSKDDKSWLELKYVLAQEWATQPHDGVPSKPVLPGFPITERIYLNDWEDPKSGETKNFGIQRAALLRECVLGKAQPGTRFIPSELIGQTVMLKLKFDPAPKNKKTGEVYGPQTTVDGYIRKGAK